jgi:ABC-type dipeptide/oligopeptide/nickel transport system permease component
MAKTSSASRFCSNLVALILVVLAGGFACAALVRNSPGFDSIPEDLNPQISPATLRTLHERAPVTLRLILWGTAGGWLLGGTLAWMAVWTRCGILETTAFTVSGLLLAIPPAVLALAFFFLQAPLALALALALLPRIFGTLRALLGDYYASPALLAARSRGVLPHVVAWRYVIRAASPQLAALMGIALVLAFGSAIPIETICGVSGIGSLALQAAVARDMPLLCGLALVITTFVTFLHALGDLVTA